jgi:hypothetical protein
MRLSRFQQLDELSNEGLDRLAAEAQRIAARNAPGVQGGDHGIYEECCQLHVQCLAVRALRGDQLELDLRA